MATDEPSGTGGVLLPEPWSDEVQAAFQRVADAMTAAAPSHWRVLELETTLLGGNGQQGMAVVEDDGSRTRTSSAGTGAFDALTELREMLYRSGVGTWYTSMCTLTERGDFEVELDYDDEPDWDLTPPSAEAYAADLARFPRDAEHTPAWLRQKLAQSGSS